MSKPITTVKLLGIATLALFGFSASSVKAEDVAEITINCDKVQLIYDIKEFTVKAGQKVKLTLVNPMESITKLPHNILIVKQGKMTAVGTLANLGLADPDFMTKKNCIPDSPDILFTSKLVLPGKSETIEFTAPKEPGDYPYLCTYPGHWILMNGVMKVK